MKAETDRKVALALAFMRDGDSQRVAARKVGCSQSNLSAAIKRRRALADTAAAFEAAADGIDEKPDGNSVESGPRPTAITEDELLEEHGIDPDDVVIQTGRASRWGQPDALNHHLRVNYERKDSMYVLPDPSTWEPPPKPDDWDCFDFAPGSFVFLTDQHLPYINKPLERAVLRYCQEEQPQQIILGGDTGDWTVLSKHKSHPRYKAMVSHTMNEIVGFLWRLRVQNPDAKIVMLEGNHDARLHTYVDERAPEISRIRPGALPEELEQGIEQPEALGFRHLWRLDELGISLIDEDWKLAKFPIAEQLTARHGHFTGANSEKKGMEKYGRSQLHGHTHTAHMLYRTKHDPLDIRVSVSSPVMAEVTEDGLGYEPEPDWTPGITTGHVWDDGDFVLNIAPFINGNLLLPGGWRVPGDA